MQRLIVILLLSLLLLSCKRSSPRIGVVNPEDVPGLKSTKWTFMHAQTPKDFDSDDEDNWEPMQPYISPDDIEMQEESNWEEAQ